MVDREIIKELKSDIPSTGVDFHIILSVNYHDKIPKEPYRPRLL